MANDITIIKADSQQANEKSLELCLKEDLVKEQAQNARELFSRLQCELDELEEDFKDGLSYLDMKNDTLLSYMIDLCNIVLKKVRGDSISGHASVERTVYYRLILEKIKAIDQRLAYQLNKVISLPDSQENQGVDVNNLDIEIESSDDSEDQEDQSASKRLQGQDDDDDDDEEDDEDDEFDGSVDDEEEQQEDDESSLVEEESKVISKKADGAEGKDKKPVGIYRPPKLRSVAYKDGKESTSSKKRHGFEEFDNLDNLEFDDDDNQDIVDETNVHRDNERTRYEEENYTRLPGANPKKAKRKLKEKSKTNKGKKKFKGNKRKSKW